MKYHVHSRLEFIPPNFNPLVLQVAHWLLPIALRFRLRPWLIGGITQIETTNVEVLVNLYQQFQAGKIRFLMAFRHPEVEDPLSMLYLMSRSVPCSARQRGISLQLPLHTHFLYDRGMTIWAGDWLGWLFAGGGGIPIHRGRPLDRLALRTARQLFASGQFPLTVAPEGATNGHGEVVSPLEPGTAQLAFWCVEDLKKANRNESVLIVPIGIRYYYLTPPWENLARLLTQLAADSGLPREKLAKLDLAEPASSLYPLLWQLAECLLSHLEEFYRRFYHQHLPHPPPESSLSPHQVLGWRLQALLDAALKVAEQYFGLASEGTVIDRCRRLEEAGWKAIYREDIKDVKSLSPLELGLADWVAEEAELRLKHMRLVESFVAVTGSYIKEKPTAERFAETSLILFDLLARIKGKKIPRRLRLGKRRVQVTVGEPISVTDRWESYCQNRQAARQAIASLTEDLYCALQKISCLEGNP